MRLTLVTLLALGLSASVLMAQDVPKAEVFAGYSYLNVDTNGLSSRQSLNGWESSISGNFNKWFAVEFDGSGYYKTVLGVNVRDYSYLAGPRINFGPLFVHGLLGGDHLTGSYQGLGASQDGFAGAFGGGVQWKIARQLYFRTSTDYVFSRHNILGGPSVTQNNFRASVGIVFAFGGERHRRGKNDQASRSPSHETTEAALLGVSGFPLGNGFEITAVQAGTPAAEGGLQAGDVIEKIDGRPVNTSRDIESALASSPSGTVRVSYLVQGNWLADREIKVR